MMQGPNFLPAVAWFDLKKSWEVCELLNHVFQSYSFYKKKYFLQLEIKIKPFQFFAFQLLVVGMQLFKQDYVSNQLKKYNDHTIDNRSCRKASPHWYCPVWCSRISHEYVVHCHCMTPKNNLVESECTNPYKTLFIYSTNDSMALQFDIWSVLLLVERTIEAWRIPH